MLSDLRLALKLLWKERAFTTTALLTLALCIGANTAIFTMLKAVVLEPLPFSEPERLARIGNAYPGVGFPEPGQNSGPDYLDRRQMTETFESVAIVNSQGFDVGVDGAPVRVSGQAVTPSFFHVLRVNALLGRTFVETEGEEGHDKFAVLSYGLWRDTFGKDAGIVGRDIRLTGVPFRVVGVMPESFESPGSDARIWVPLALYEQLKSSESRHSNNFSMIVRLKTGVSLAQAQERLAALDRRNLELYPEYKEILINARYASVIRSYRDEMVKDVRPMLYLLQAAVLLVLLIGCVNVANLLLVRSNARLREMAIRFSLGAGRLRLARQLLVEALVLAGAGGGLGVATAFAGVRLLATLGARDMPRGTTIAIDGGALAFSAAIAALTGLVFGSVPVWHLMRRDLDAVFRGGSRGGTADRRTAWTRSALVVCQVSLAFVLLTGAGLLTLSLEHVVAVKPGFRTENVATAAFSLPRMRYPDDAKAQLAIANVLERARRIPGVVQAAVNTTLPFGPNRSDGAIAIDGRPLGPGELPPVPFMASVSSDYFTAMSIPLLEGRAVAESDTAEAPEIAVIDQALARKYWPKGGAIGATFRRGVDGKGPQVRIVGVVGTVKMSDLAEAREQGAIYFSFRQSLRGRSPRVVMKTAATGMPVTAALRSELARVDPELALYDIRSMEERLALSTRNRRAAMTICGVFAGLALSLAAIGLYGVLAYGVAQRFREFGIRMALGAAGRDVLGMVAGHGLRLVVTGLAIGVAGAAALTRLMSTMLFGIAPNDARVFATAGAVLVVVAAVAAAAPAARALRIPPSAALRQE